MQIVENVWLRMITMIIARGRKYQTTIDAAKALGVSAKTIREYINRGIIPPPPLVSYGVRLIRSFTPKYIASAKELIKKYQGRDSKTGYKK
jgi:DNA-binding transcriptional MerR regulator